MFLRCEMLACCLVTEGFDAALVVPSRRKGFGFGSGVWFHCLPVSQGHHLKKIDGHVPRWANLWVDKRAATLEPLCTAPIALASSFDVADFVPVKQEQRVAISCSVDCLGQWLRRLLVSCLQG